MGANVHRVGLNTMPTFPKIIFRKHWNSKLKALIAIFLLTVLIANVVSSKTEKPFILPNVT